MSKKTHEQLKTDVLSFVEKACPGIALTVEINPRWDRLCFEFRWDGFADLLLEERFRRVARLIPGDYFETHCHGAVWLELTPGESVGAYLGQPRSEDVDGELPEIWNQLGDLEFFARLEDELVRIPPKDCPDDLAISKRVLRACSVSEDDLRRFCLAFIRHDAYTDWEVLKNVRTIAEAPKTKPEEAKPKEAKPKKTRTRKGKKA